MRAKPKFMEEREIESYWGLTDPNLLYGLFGFLALLLVIVVLKKPVCYFIGGIYLRIRRKVETVVHSIHQRRYQWEIMCREQDLKIKAQQQEIDALYGKLQEKSEQLRQYTIRLSQEMNQKVSADESNVENVSIKNRPMNIAEDYENLCTDEWLLAKETLDEEVRDMKDHVKILLLFRILMTASQEIDHFYSLYWSHLQEVFKNPSAMFTSHEHFKPLDRSQDQLDLYNVGLPKALVNNVCDFLRNSDDMLYLNRFVEKVLENLGDIPYEVENSAHHRGTVVDLCKTEPALTKYTEACLYFCWKMAIQRPQMKFKVANKYLGESYHDIHWNSVQPTTEHVVAHVYPMLYHGKSLMKKGKVLLLPATPEDMDTDDDL